MSAPKAQRVRHRYPDDVLAESARRVRAELPLTLEQFGAFLGVSKRTVQRWVEASKFSEVLYVTPGDARIPPQSYSEFISHRTVRRPSQNALHPA